MEDFHFLFFWTLGYQYWRFEYSFAWNLTFYLNLFWRVVRRYPDNRHPNFFLLYTCILCLCSRFKTLISSKNIYHTVFPYICNMHKAECKNSPIYLKSYPPIKVPKVKSQIFYWWQTILGKYDFRTFFHQTLKCS